MFDPEIEALQKCTEVLAPLEEDGKVRVIQYLINRFKLTGSPQPSIQSHRDSPGTDNGQPLLNSTTIVVDPSSAKKTLSSGHPSLRDVVIKNLPKSEVEWVLIYFYYASDFGTKEATKEEIVALYNESKRFTAQAHKNLTYNINSAVKKDWIQSINNTEFIILEAGRDYAVQILEGHSITKQRKATKSKPKTAVSKND